MCQRCRFPATFRGKCAKCYAFSFCILLGNLGMHPFINPGTPRAGGVVLRADDGSFSVKFLCVS